MRQVESQSKTTAVESSAALSVMPDRIAIEVDFSDYPMRWEFTDSAVECWILGKLQDAGIPAEGVILFRGIKNGMLTAYDDFERPMIRHFVWKA